MRVISFIKKIWASLFYCKQCKSHFSRGLPYFYLCKGCYAQLRIRAAEIGVENRARQKERREEFRKILNRRKKEQIVEAMKQAVLELKSEGKL